MSEEEARAQEVDAAGAREAYVAWSALAEPADMGAAWLVATLGPQRALSWVGLVARNSVAASMELAACATPAQVDEAVRLSEKWVARLGSAAPDAHLDRADKCGARVVTRGTPQWPRCMDDLGPLAPFALWVRGTGDLALLMDRAIAIVGARSATAYGEHVTSSIGAELVDRGATVVSGGAYGIDAAAHRIALAMAEPTVAMMAGGVDRLYPAGNAAMLERVLDGGLAVSEVPPGYAPHRSRFLSRNRLIATARATVVVEAALRSGALSTARHAAAMVRPVCAVPGPVTSASSAGCHALIRDGLASLVTTGADVLAQVEPIGTPAVSESPAGTDRVDGVAGREPVTLGEPDFGDAAQRQAFGAIGGRRSSIEEISREAGLTVDEARAALGGLELAGLARYELGKWSRSRTQSR